MAEEKTTETFTLKQRIKWLIAFRFAFASVLIAATWYVKPGAEGAGALFGPFGRSVFIIAVIHLFANVAFYVTYRYLKFSKLNLLAYSQIAWDLVFTTSFVSITGGLDSDIKQLYWLTIAFAAILLFRFGAFLAATLSSLLYAGLLNLELFKIVRPILNIEVQTHIWQEDRVMRSIVLHSIGFFLVAYVMSWASTKLRQAETMLEETSADLQDLEVMMGRIVESITSGLATLDARGRISFWSRAAEGITGLRWEDVRSRPFIEIFPGAKDSLDSSSAPPDLQKQWRWEMEYEAVDHQTKMLGFSISPLRHGADGQPGTLAIFQDLTTFREMEDKVRRADRLAAVGELAARIAHEIRNPLTSVSGSIEVLRKNPALNDRDQKLMDIVVRETDRLNQLLTDFLAFARPPAPRFEEVALDQLLRETSELFSKSHKEAKLDLQLKLDGGVTVHGDARQLNQMFWNLIKNASEAMPKGGLINVRLNEDFKNGHVWIEVQDHGPGIPKNIQERIFTPFFTTKPRGTGLGLAMVRRIAEEHAGEVVVETREGEGTSFKIKLPKIHAETAVES